MLSGASCSHCLDLGWMKGSTSNSVSGTGLVMQAHVHALADTEGTMEVVVHIVAGTISFSILYIVPGYHLYFSS